MSGGLGERSREDENQRRMEEDAEWKNPGMA